MKKDWMSSHVAQDKANEEIQLQMKRRSQSMHVQFTSPNIIIMARVCLLSHSHQQISTPAANNAPTRALDDAVSANQKMACGLHDV